MKHLKLTSAATALIVGLVAAPAAAAPLSDAEATAITASIDAQSARLSKLALDIWNYSEVGYRETKSAARLIKELRAAGFRVEEGVDGIPTAFIATAGSGGPVIAVLAEYDALPGLSQTASPTREVAAGHSAGHGCGHNLLGAGAVGAAIALKEWLERTGAKGTIRLYGTPAEEGGFAKVFLARDGYFKDVDVTLNWHPGSSNGASQGQSLALITGKFRFKGVAAHAAAAPDRGRSALDGVEILDIAANYLREHVPQEARIQYTITDGGGQPNVVPETAEVFYYVRHYDAEVVKDIWGRLEKAAQGAALATGTTVSVELVGGAYSRLPNITLGKIADRSLRRVGGYSYTPQEAEYARRLQATLPPAVVARAKGPEHIEDFVVGRKGSASSDVGDVSWVTPTVGMSAATFPGGVSVHSWQAVSAAGASIGVKGAIVAAKTLALTGAELFHDPQLIAEAKKEFDESRGPGFVYRALIGDQKPPLNYTENQKGAGE